MNVVTGHCSCKCKEDLHICWNLCGRLGLVLIYFPVLSGLWWSGSCSGTRPNPPTADHKLAHSNYSPVWEITFTYTIHRNGFMSRFQLKIKRDSHSKYILRAKKIYHDQILLQLLSVAHKNKHISSVENMFWIIHEKYSCKIPSFEPQLIHVGVSSQAYLLS